MSLPVVPGVLKGEKQKTTDLSLRRTLVEKDINQKDNVLSEKNKPKDKLKTGPEQSDQQLKGNHQVSKSETAATLADNTTRKENTPSGRAKPTASRTEEKGEGKASTMKASSLITPQRGRSVRGVVSAFKLDQLSIANKFASELKMMEQSIRAVRDRSNEMDRIKEGIRQSFLNRNRKPPAYQDLLDKSVLKNLEEQLEQMKKEKQALTESQTQGFVTPLKVSKEVQAEKPLNNETLDPKVNEKLERLEKLEKQCEEYQRNMDLLRKKNEELALMLQQTKIEYSSKSQEERQKAEQEIRKFKQDRQELVDRIKRLEEKLQHSDQTGLRVDTIEATPMDKPAMGLREDSEPVKYKHTDYTTASQSGNERSASLDPRLHNGQIFYRSGRVFKNERAFNAPQTLKTDSSDGEMSNIKVFQSFEDSSDAIPHYNIFTRPNEPVVISRAEPYYKEKDSRPQSRSKNHRKLRIAKKSRDSTHHPEPAIYIQDVPEQTFYTPIKQNDYWSVKRLSPSLRKTETIIEDDRIRRAEARQRMSARSSAKSSARQYRCEERSSSPPQDYSDEIKQGGIIRNNIFFRTKDIFGTDPESDEWEMTKEQVSGEVYVLKELQSRLQTAGSLTDFKLNCLKSKGILFGTDSLQVGVATNIYKRTPLNYLQIMIYFGNRLNEDITEFRTSHSQGLNLDVITEPDQIQSVVNSNRQVRQQLVISFNEVPFGCLQMTCEGLFGGSYNCFFVLFTYGDNEIHGV